MCFETFKLRIERSNETKEIETPRQTLKQNTASKRVLIMQIIF